MITKPPDLGVISAFQKVLAQESGRIATPLLVGASYEGQVLAQLDDDTVAIRIDNHTFSMQVGKEIVPGQTLNFKYLGIRPNHSFLLLKPNIGPPTIAEKVLISETASLITQYIQETDAHSALTEIEETNSTRAPLANKPNNPQATAHELKQAIVLSGLFYEAHLADFTEGKRGVDLIMQEPQNKVTLDPSQVISRQLDILENKSLQWSGPIWPGQMMHWKIELDQSRQEEGAEGQDQQAAREVGITSTLELDLPNLQKVLATFTVCNGSLRIDLQAANPQTHQRFKSELQGLTQALHDSGHHLDAIQVRAYEQA
jgi:hypothetical protein